MQKAGVSLGGRELRLANGAGVGKRGREVNQGEIDADLSSFGHGMVLPY
jgi:hypothetical protein